MIGALEVLRRQRDPHGLPEQVAAFGILGGRAAALEEAAS